MIFCRIFIGYKVNHDVYMSEEKVSMVQLGKYFFQTLIFHENIIQTQIIQSQNKKMMALQTEAINELTNLIENHESEDTFYTKRIYKYVELLAKKARSEGYNADVLTNEYINLLSQAAVIHDIGKIVIPNDILKKPSKLTDEEFEIVKTHTTEGVKIVQDALKNRGNDEIVKLVSSIAGSHHEMWNGKGYPDRLMGEEIPLAARIVAIADVFDALTMPRCYKEPVSIDKAFKIIEESSGIHFDPVLAGFFKELKEPIEQYLDGLDN